MGLSATPLSDRTPRPQARFSPHQRVIALLLFLMMVLNYLDRSALSVLAPVIRQDLGLSPIQYAWAVNAFLFAYGIMYTGSGLIFDRVGYRLGLALFVTAWSVAAGLHAATYGFASLLVFRFLLGLAEPAGFTGAVKAVSSRFSAEQRGLATGIFTSGAGVGTLLSAPLIVTLMLHYGWRSAFLAPALLGLVWVPFWLRATRPAPGEPAIEPPARRDWSHLRNRRALAYILARFFGDSSGYFFVFWMPEYLVSGRSFTMEMVRAMAWIPPCFTDLGALTGGWLSGRLVQRAALPVIARKRIMTLAACFVLAGVLLQISAGTARSILSLSVCTFGVGMWAANLHSLPADSFPKHFVATIHGLAGSAGAVGGIVFNSLVGYFTAHGDYGTAVALVALLQPLALIGLWLWLTPPLPEPNRN